MTHVAFLLAAEYAPGASLRHLFGLSEKATSAKLRAQGGGRDTPKDTPAPNHRSAMDDKKGQIDEMGEAREAQYALECVLVRLSEAELQRVIEDHPQRAREHIRVTTAHKIRHLGE